MSAAYLEGGSGEQRATAREMQRGMDPSMLLVEVITRALQEGSVARQFGGDIGSARGRQQNANARQRVGNSIVRSAELQRLYKSLVRVEVLRALRSKSAKTLAAYPEAQAMVRKHDGGGGATAKAGV